MAGERQAIRVEGLGRLIRGLRTVSVELPREFRAVQKEAASRTILPDARSLTPHRSGRLAASERVEARGNRVSLVSRLPYANPIHWGWPKHNIKGARFFERALEQNAEPYLDAVADSVGDFLNRRV